jgi:hypothetical protein
MSYSCSDFVDSILDALEIEVPEEAWDDPSAQADLALAKIDAYKELHQAATDMMLHWSQNLSQDAQRIQAALRDIDEAP